MSKFTRRDFIKSSMAAGAAIAMAGPFSKVLGANDDIRVAIVGIHSKGRGHIGDFYKIPGVRVVALCDVDKNILDREVKKITDRNEQVDAYIDYRKMLENKNIDAVVIAAPNHWHSLMAVWACQAGKDVYVEKPVSHEIWEGRKIIEAAHKYNRIVATGTQKRSSEAHKAAFDWIHEGHIGAIKWARGFCYKQRYESHGIVNRTNGPIPIPEGVDYNLWCGPAEMEPLRRKELHYKWHWVWNTGNGDIGNQGVHEMDLSRWALGDPGLPERVISIGGRLGVNDAGETANTQIAFFDYKPAPLIFEVRGLPRAKGQRSMDRFRIVDIGIVIQCEGGYFAGGDGGGWIWDNDGKRTDKQFAGGGGGGHQANFIKAVRSRKSSDLNASIEKGHLSSSLCHMANISYRIGQHKPAEQIKETIADNSDYMDSFGRMLEHLKVNELDLEKEPITMGPMLTMNADKEMFVGDHSETANLLLKRNYREPFVLPDKV